MNRRTELGTIKGEYRDQRRVSEPSLGAAAGPREGLLTARDLAERFQVPRRTIYAYVDSGALECLHVGPKLLRFSEDQVRAFLDRDEDVAS